MRKHEIIILFIFMIISSVYCFIKPSEVINNIEVKQKIVVEVNGKINQKLVFDHQPKIKEIFTKCNLKNTYGFDDNYIINVDSVFYIPSGKKLISLNKGSIQDFTSIQGIGEKTAQKIIAQRKISLFKTIEDIKKVSGIGEKKYLKIREYFCL